MNKSSVTVTDFDPGGPFAGLILPPRFRKRQSETRFKQHWKITAAQYLTLMREGYELHCKKWLPLPRYQRGSIILAGFGVPSAPSAGSVLLSAHFFSASGLSGTVISGIEFQNDGELYEIDSEFGNVQQNGEWWTAEPQTSIGSSYEARHLSSGKTGTYSFEAAAANVWITLNVNRQWNVERSTSGAKNCTAMFEVGLDGVESALDSAIVNVTANVDL